MTSWNGRRPSACVGIITHANREVMSGSSNPLMEVSMRRFGFRLLLTVMFARVLSGPPLAAQTQTGTITGIVTDEQRASCRAPR
jgi:hypothetical protein